ncbi:Hypothetical protein SMAX5B_011913 [Scophthalmus maximus]|uniref:Uncharacterized protein n=1 Tax=Scophthalmus maximus TaxID=52904 RepID=A0A2U9AYM5_SCOMX|nr:Hypothetical protein SMAX5B_011913 [Scophthalmus maximus]
MSLHAKARAAKPPRNSRRNWAWFSVGLHPHQNSSRQERAGRRRRRRIAATGPRSAASIPSADVTRQAHVGVSDPLIATSSQKERKEGERNGTYRITRADGRIVLLRVGGRRGEITNQLNHL